MPELALGEKLHTTAGEGPLLKQTILREGEWTHKNAPGGKLVVDKGLLDELKRNFDAGVGLADKEIPAHIGHTEHKDDRAVAWATVAVEPDPDRPGKHRMVALARPTSDEHRQRVLGGEYRYVSPTIAYGFRDNESGQTHKAVLRNFAYTNYPYLKKMGAAQVVNLSEIAEAEGDSVALDDLLGGKTAGNPDWSKLPAGVKPEDVPTQCHTCARLGNDCPFAAANGKDDLALKQAAAGQGNCPQYKEADSQTPGAAPDGGQKTALSEEGYNPNELSSAPSTGTYPTGGKTPALQPVHHKTLKALSDAGGHMASWDLAKTTYGDKLDGNSMQSLDTMDRGGHWGHLVKHGLMTYKDMHPDDDSKVMGGVNFHITPLGKQALSRHSTTAALSERKMPKTTKFASALARIAEMEKQEQVAFVTALAETHKLPADALKIIENTFKTGFSTSVALSEAIEANEVALSEGEHAETFNSVDLSDCVVMTRKQYRDAINAAATAPRTGVTKDGTSNVENPDRREISLSEQLKDASPDEAVKIVREWEKKNG
jgi:hypothetical protein